MQCWVYFPVLSVQGGRTVHFNAASVGLWQQDQRYNLEAAVASPLNSEEGVHKTSVVDLIQV